MCALTCLRRVCVRARAGKAGRCKSEQRRLIVNDQIKLGLNPNPKPKFPKHSILDPESK